MKYLKTYEGRLSYKLSDQEWEDFNKHSMKVKSKFKVNDNVYANPNLEQNMNMKDKKFQIIEIFPTGYVIVDRYPNFALAEDRLISEEEYNANKYNL